MRIKKVKGGNIRQNTGVPGDILFFDCNIVHGFGYNMSPLPRKLFIISYNTIDNNPRSMNKPQPYLVVARQFDIIE